MECKYVYTCMELIMFKLYESNQCNKWHTLVQLTKYIASILRR